MPRLLKIALRALLVLIGVLLTLMLLIVAFTYIIFSPSREEVYRVTSPSGNFVATVTEINGGATTSFGYEVNVSRTGFNLGGAEVASLYGAFRSDRAYGVNLRWISDQELRIEYLRAQSAEVIPSRILVPSVRVVLQPGIEDPSAPAGGMLQNL